MNTLTISLIMFVIISVGSLSLILAINHDASNLENDVKKIVIQEMAKPIEPVDAPQEITKYPQTTITELNENSIIKTTTAVLSIPENNTHPFGYIQGKVVDAAEGHPVILQIYKSLEEGPIHVAQVELKDDNTFEYSFRILNIDDGITTHLYEGDYFVKVIKVVNKIPQRDLIKN